MTQDTPLTLEDFLAPGQDVESSSLGFSPGLQHFGDDEGVLFKLGHQLLSLLLFLVRLKVGGVGGVRENCQALLGVPISWGRVFPSLGGETHM